MAGDFRQGGGGGGEQQPGTPCVWVTPGTVQEQDAVADGQE